MVTVTLLWLPIAALLLLTFAGAGLVSLAAPRLPPAARFALSAPVAAAVDACLSPLARLGLRPSLIGLLTIGGLSLITITQAPRLRKSLRISGLPLLAALVAVLISSAPALANRSWIEEMYGNGDPYYWISQAQALQSGQIAGPASSHPDLLAYSVIDTQHWQVALPVGLAQISALAGRNPVDVYDAFSAVLFALLVLAVYGVARGILHWPNRLAGLAAVCVSLDGYLAFANYYGWQAELALITFGVLALSSLVACLDEKSPPNELFLPALFAAAGVATYGWLFGIYASFALIVVLQIVVSRLRRSLGIRRILSRVAVVAAGSVLIGAIPVVEALEAFAPPGVVAAWSKLRWALPSDALGLRPPSDTLSLPGGNWSGRFA